MTEDNLTLAFMLLLSMLVTFFLTPSFIALQQQGKSSFRTINYEGKNIINAGGIVILPAIMIPLLLYRGIVAYRLLLLIFLVGIVALGLIDDLMGEKGCKGFRGHFTALCKEKKITTGFLKALGGFSLAMFAAAGGGSIQGIDWFVRAGVLALFANLFNLLDTRPGLAIKAFYLVSLGFLFSGVGAYNLILLLWAVLFIYLPWELSRKIMLGDTGAYLLGGALGFISVFSFSARALYVILALLMLLHLLLERYSLSCLLDRGVLLQFYGVMSKWRRNT